jgi:hypothetical protein
MAAGQVLGAEAGQGWDEMAKGAVMQEHRSVRWLRTLALGTSH